MKALSDDPFGKRIVLKTDAFVIPSQSTLVCLAKLQQQGVAVSVLGER
jgi:hypothetical protein